MSPRRERGFKKIKIADSSMDITDPDQLIENESFCFSKKCFIISIITAIILILTLISLLIINGKKRNKLKYFTNRRIYNNNNTNINNYTEYNKNIIETNQYNISISKNINFNEEKISTKKTYNINEIIKDINKTIESKKSNNANENIKISIIIMNNDIEIENNFEKLFLSIESQSFPNKEIFIIKSYSENDSYWDNLNNYKNKATIVKYGKNTGRLKQRYDIINMAKGEYILFIEGNDEFSSNEILNQIYEKASKDKLDILEYKPYHNNLEKNKIYYQPELFSSMYFGRDNFNKLVQFHLCGKLIQREFFLNIFKKENISPFYFNQDLHNFDQSMLLLLLFRYAENYEIFEKDGTNNNCNKCEKVRHITNLKEGLDLLVYMRFLVEHTGNNVPEKRMAAEIFTNDFLNKRINFISKEDLNMISETLDLYLNCDKIGEQEKERIHNYKNDISKKLEDLK
jgi:hypothetical protein